MGYGCKIDYKRAFQLFMKAAEQSDSSAQMAIGRAFYRGEGVDEDNHEAAKWFELSHQNGDDEATYYLGECYYNGYGVDEDEQKAIELLSEAAERDNDNALSLLQNIGVNIDHMLEENAEVSQVVQLHADLEVKARKLYSKTIADKAQGEATSDSGNVINLEATKKARLELLAPIESDE